MTQSLPSTELKNFNSTKLPKYYKKPKNKKFVLGNDSDLDAWKTESMDYND